jgi:hypothetical protein
MSFIRFLGALLRRATKSLFDTASGSETPAPPPEPAVLPQLSTRVAAPRDGG